MKWADFKGRTETREDQDINLLVVPSNRDKSAKMDWTDSTLFGKMEMCSKLKL